MMRWLTVSMACLWLFGATAGCKGETKYKDKPETVAAMDKCQQSVTEKDGYIKDLEAKIYDLEKQAKASEGNEIVVAITGDTIEIKKGKDKGPNVKNNGPAAADEDLYKAFVNHVRKSKGSIQRCYTNALKKDSGLQAKTITLKLSVRFKADGKVSKATFTPRISDSFNTCMSTVAKRWTLQGTRQSITFQQPVTLSPQ